MPFSSFGLHPDLLRGVKEMGFTRPTPIQQDAIPPSMEGRDVLACAMTGSGKTAAFVLPILHRLMPKRRGVTRALIVTPTRELAAQIDEHLSQMAALAGFKSGRFRILVATDIAARGIDVEALSHVINFDVPAVPDDYIHRVGRTARAELTGDAFTFVSPEEEGDLAAIERAVGKRLPRIVLPDFDYNRRASEKLEVPLGERIAAIRARKAEDRARAKAKAERSEERRVGKE